MTEMENALGLERLSGADQLEVGSIERVEIESREWTKELERAVQDVGRIAKSRLTALGVE